MTVEHQYLRLILKENEWALPFLFERIYKIEYDKTIKHWAAFPLLESLNRSTKAVVIVAIFDGYNTTSYRWCRPHLDAIVAEQNFTLLRHLLDRDLLDIYDHHRSIVFEISD